VKRKPQKTSTTLSTPFLRLPPNYVSVLPPHRVLDLQHVPPGFARHHSTCPFTPKVYPQTFNDGTHHQTSHTSRSRYRQPRPLIRLSLKTPQESGLPNLFALPPTGKIYTVGHLHDSHAISPSDYPIWTLSTPASCDWCTVALLLTGTYPPASTQRPLVYQQHRPCLLAVPRPTPTLLRYPPLSPVDYLCHPIAI